MNPTNPTYTEQKGILQYLYTQNLITFEEWLRSFIHLRELHQLPVATPHPHEKKTCYYEPVE